MFEIIQKSLYKNKIKKLNEKYNFFKMVTFQNNDEDYDLASLKSTFSKLDNFYKIITESGALKNRLSASLNIILSDKVRPCSFSSKEKIININLNEQHTLQTYNHELLHYLDYETGQSDYFSEKKIDKIKQQNNIYKFQKNLLNNNGDNFNIHIFDFNLFIESVSIYLKKSNIELNNIIIKNCFKNRKLFHDFLNSYDHLSAEYSKYKISEGQKEILFFDIKQYLTDKKQHIPNLKKDYLNILKFYRFFNKYIDNQSNIEKFNTFFLKECLSTEIINKHFNYLNGNLNSGIFNNPESKHILLLRSLYYTPTLNKTSTKINYNLAKKIIENNQQIHDSLIGYLISASEKISYAGQENKGNFLKQYISMVTLKKNINFNIKQQHSFDKENIKSGGWSTEQFIYNSDKPLNNFLTIKQKLPFNLQEKENDKNLVIIKITHKNPQKQTENKEQIIDTATVLDKSILKDKIRKLEINNTPDIKHSNSFKFR